MESVVEGLLYVQGDLGLSLGQIEDILGIDEETAKRVVFNLKNYYVENNRGLRINFLGNTVKLTTNDLHKEYYMKLVEDSSTNNLSQSALETLAIIAYNEPITRGNIDSLRGVDSSYIIRRLLAKGFIKECGKSELPGRPILYKTTDEFLDYFGLSTKDDLPDISLIVPNDKEDCKDLYTSIYKEEGING